MTPVDRAYVAAGYRDTQWARSNGSRLAHLPDVAKRIDELREEFKTSAALSVEYLQRQLLPAAEANMLDFSQFEDGKPRLKNLADLRRHHGGAIAAVKVGDDGTIEIKLHNKNDAVNVLLRSIGALPQDGANATVNVMNNVFGDLSFDEQQALADAIADFRRQAGRDRELVAGNADPGAVET